MKKYYKICLFILCFALIAMPTCAFATGGIEEEERVIANISNSILSILSWFAYAFAIAFLIILGILYNVSAANEKARLKSKIPLYMVGVGLVVLAFALAQSIAGAASRGKDRDEVAGSIIDVGIEAGKHFTGEYVGTGGETESGGSTGNASVTLPANDKTSQTTQTQK